MIGLKGIFRLAIREKDMAAIEVVLVGKRCSRENNRVLVHEGYDGG